MRHATPCARDHLRELVTTAVASGRQVDLAHGWGTRLAAVLDAGGRLLAAGNGGSAAQAQHLTAELVGRYRHDRRPFSAICLSAETSSLTAIVNDFPPEELFARQVEAHGRPGDVLVLLSTSGTSANVVAAAERGRRLGLTVWAMTGPAPNPLAHAADEALCVEARFTATVQELHLVALHVLCAGLDAELGVVPAGSTESVGGGGRPVSAPLVVVGDTLLDVDVEGRAGRLAPDAPVPVLDRLVERARPGGAGLAAVMAARAGHDVVLVTALGGDDAGRQAAGLLADAGVTVLALTTTGATPVKRRVRAAGQSLLRLDSGDETGEVTAVPPAVAQTLEAAGAVLVADYGRGVTASLRLRPLLAAAAGRVPLVWDPHPRGAVPVPGARLVTPNAAEAELLADAYGVQAPPGAGGLTALRARADGLVRAWAAHAVAVTRGEHGALLSYGDGPPVAVPAPTVAAGATGLDPCGAGDRFAVAVATSLAAGAVVSEAVSEAVVVAAEYVAAGGPASLRHAAVAPRTDDTDRVAAVRAAGGVVVATGGCFDLLHAGHVATLRAARRLGDCLVVCLNSDASVRRLKGPGRPLVPAGDRRQVLEALECVDAVVVFDEDTPVETLRRLRPDVWVKGGDYTGADVPETPVVAAWGGQAVVVPYLPGRSTTRLAATAAQQAADRTPSPPSDPPVSHSLSHPTSQTASHTASHSLSHPTSHTLEEAP